MLRAAPDQGSRRVLVVDDDPAIRLVLRRALARCGYDIFVAEDGAAALDAIDREPEVFAVVTDITMPRMTGTELAVAILQRSLVIPILFVTSTPADPGLLEHPLVGLVVKPVRIADVRSALAVLVERATADRRRPAPAAAVRERVA